MRVDGIQRPIVGGDLNGIVVHAGLVVHACADKGFPLLCAGGCVEREKPSGFGADIDHPIVDRRAGQFQGKSDRSRDWPLTGETDAPL